MDPRAVSVGPPEGEDELRQLVDTHRRTYLWTTEDGERWLKQVDPADLLVVRAGSRIAGGLHLWRMGQWFGGRSVPMTGIGNVGIDPAHRGSGLATELMDRTLRALHADGASLSALFPATQPVYRRVGYELAGTWTRYRLPTEAIDHRYRDLEIHRTEEAGAIRRLYERRAVSTNGNLDRSDAFWERVLRTHNADVHVYVVGDDEPSGYVVFTQRRDGDWKYDVACRDLVAFTPEAGRRLLAFFADHRSFAKDVTWNGPVADPVTYLLREQDWSADRSWTWMLRVVDVRGALEGRGYPPGLEAELHLEVLDDVCTWNHGRFVLEVSDGEGRVRKGGRGRLRIDVRGLAAVYTGHLGATDLVRAGLAEGDGKELRKATAIFAGPAPWLVDFF